MGYPFELPDLGYDVDALEPHIDARTMEIHHGKHHQGYTNNLNAAVEGYPDLHGHSAEHLLAELPHLPDAIQTAVRNNGGGYVNHTLFWSIMAPGGATEPSGELAEAIDAAFGSLDELKTSVGGAGAKQFGSGWGWLTSGGSGELKASSTANQENPLTDGLVPILGVDVWEHAYYLNYQNRRPDYIAAWWNVVNWDVVAANYADARG